MKLDRTAKTATVVMTSIAVAVLAACGGGGGSGSSPASTTPSNPAATATQPIALLAAPRASAAGSVTLTGDVVADSFNYANNKRAQLGLSTLKNVAQVNTAAQNHAIYMFDANSVGHYEVAGQPGYTGVSPADRVAAAGYTTNATSEIAAGIPGAFTSTTEAVDALFDAPFHRAIFLFDTTGVGFGQGPANTSMSAYSTLVGDFVDYVQQTPDNKLVAYPYNGQTNVKPTWVANESPNPMSFYSANPTKYVGATVGYPVTLSAAGNGVFSNITFTITDAAGNPVSCQEVDNTATSEATRLAMCVPFAPLATNTTYKVTVTGSLTNNTSSIVTGTMPFSVTWSFTTGASAAVQARQLPAGSGSALPTVLN